jgi:hypothetical protein
VDTDNCPAGCTARDNSHGIDEPIARVCRQQSAFPLTYRAGPIRSRLGGSNRSRPRRQFALVRFHW